MIMSQKADLHIHTRYSDGSLSPKDIVRIASERGICCISITDHDSVFGIDEAMSAGNAYGVEIIPGAEISAENAGKELHILGYCIDYRDKKLLDFLGRIRHDRVERLYKMIELLKKHGIEIDIEDFKKHTGDVSISRLHLAKYMHKKGFVTSWREAFSRYIGDNKPCYVSSFRYTSKEVIDIIKRSGGIPVIAHPGISRLDDMLLEFVNEGIRGIEVFHSDHSSNAVTAYENFAKTHNLIITGGSDCHGDLKGDTLIGKTAIPYAYVEVLKNASKIC
jgi:3',5'-nucleoside bisphosphate phosphatase